MERPRITLEVTFRDIIDGEEVHLKGYFTFEVENHIITVRAASLPNNGEISAADDGIISERGFKICTNVEGNEDVTKCLLCPCLLPTAMNQNDLPVWKQQGTRSDQCICCKPNDLAKQLQNKDTISTCQCDPANRDGPELPKKIERLIKVTYELESELEKTSKVRGPSEEEIFQETPKRNCLCNGCFHEDAAKKLPEQAVQSPTPMYENDQTEQKIISPQPAMQKARTPVQTPQQPSPYLPQGSPRKQESAFTASPNQTESKRTTQSDNLTDFRRLEDTLSTSTDDEQSFEYPQTRPRTPQLSTPKTPQAGDRAFIDRPHQTDNLTDFRRLEDTLSTSTDDEQSFENPQTQPRTPQLSTPETPQAGDRAFIDRPHQTGVSQPDSPDTDLASRKEPTKKVTFADETQYNEPPEKLEQHHLDPIDTKLTRPEETFDEGEPFTSPRQLAHPTDRKELAGPSCVDSPQPVTAETGMPPKTTNQPPEYFDPNSSIVISEPIASSTPLRISLEDGKEFVPTEQIPQPVSPQQQQRTPNEVSTSKQVNQPETVGPVDQNAPVEQFEDLVLYDLIKEVYDLHKLNQNSALEESKQDSFHEESEVGPLKALRAIHNQRMDELHKHAEKVYNKKYNPEELDTFRKVVDQHKSESKEGVNFWDDSNFYVAVNKSLRELPNEQRTSFTQLQDPGQNTNRAGFPSDFKKSKRKSSWIQRSSEFLRFSANSLKLKLGFNRPNTRSEINRSTRLQFISVSEDNFFTNGYLMFIFHLFYGLYAFIFQFSKNL